MGHAFVSQWLEIGDLIVIGNIGNNLYVSKIDIADQDPADVVFEIARNINRDEIFRRANSVKGRPPKASYTRTEYKRSPWVVFAALLRADSECEMPSCNHESIIKDDGTVYLEVHHVVPLAEDGTDELINAAALCPRCHRDLHVGKDRMAKRAVLSSHLSTVTP